MAEDRVCQEDLSRSAFIRNLEDPHFKMHFRMDKATFEILVRVVANERLRTGKLQRNRSDVGEATLMGLWMIFNKDTFRSVGLNFEHDKKTIHHHYCVLLDVLCGVGKYYIKWPNARQRQATELFYRRNFGFPGVAGVIDGTLVRTTAPAEQTQRYVDKNHDYSINVMIVDDLLGPNQHLIGDGGYTCTKKMLVRYMNNGHMAASHRLFNFKLSQCRATIERTSVLKGGNIPGKIGNLGERCRKRSRLHIGNVPIFKTQERTNSLFKSRMARTEKLFCKSIIQTNKHIATFAVLHNFILLNGEEQDGISLEAEMMPEVNVHERILAEQEEGYAKRHRIRIQLTEEYEGQ
ncbi:Protein ANTAGONIST OF LIKE HETEROCHROMATIN PROTEIN 1 [Frankliniella fusca]|uniref:Protein ANTAGONIST OF LIKE HETEROCHROMATIN PROTEIN 1 n=1 Tax=Frankliniella fusca TaxID=407009 RepID=A0AAE1LV09_9NEOP|nr:Protein ANTAGONIST OF LIKE HETEROCHROMATIN PROTEIN 1 [Frankliniella fusca]